MRSCRLAFGLFWLGFGFVGWVMMKEDAQHLMPDNRVVSALFWIKLIHTLAFLVISAAIFYILYSGLFNVGGTGLVIALIVVVTEIVVFAANGFHCPLTLDSRAPKLPLKDYLHMENCFRMLEMSKPEAAARLFEEAQQDVNTRWAFYEYMASRASSSGKEH